MKLEDIKVGDEIVEFSGGMESKIFLVKVERITKTLIILSNGTRYRKDSGYLSGGGQWNHSYIVIATPENREMARKNTLRRRCRTALFLMDKNSAKLSDGAREAIIEICKSEKKRLE